MPDAIVLHVNGEERKLEVDPERTLLEVLRDELGLTGAKYGCGEGQCGACTVMVDGVDRRSCQMRVDVVAGAAIRTVEGLANGDRLHPLQQAFLDHGALQCGFCTSGMLVAGAALLAHEPKPDAATIRRGLQGQICRCGCYARIVAAVQHVARANAGGGR